MGQDQERTLSDSLTPLVETPGPALCPPLSLASLSSFPPFQGCSLVSSSWSPYRFFFPLARLNSPTCHQVCMCQVPITTTWFQGLYPHT